MIKLSQLKRRKRPMIHYITAYLYELTSLVQDMAPWLLLGFGIAGILHVCFPEGKINQLLGASSTRHVFRAAIFGIPLPLCSCGVIPTGISIYRSGASKGASISFLISTPQTGVDSIMVTYSLPRPSVCDFAPDHSAGDRRVWRNHSESFGKKMTTRERGVAERERRFKNLRNQVSTVLLAAAEGILVVPPQGSQSSMSILPCLPKFTKRSIMRWSTFSEIFRARCLSG